MKNNVPKKAMTDAAKEARNKYRREWAQKNPDKVRDITRRYWERKAAKIAEGGG